MNSVEIKRKLSESNYRLTSSREEVINALLTAHGHITADDLYDALKSQGSSVGRMTVFRTLDILSETGIVRPIYQGSGAAHFVLLEEGHHHHLVCIKCSESVEFSECMLAEELSNRLAKTYNFKIEGHMLEIYGICSKCQ
ncbi:MAG: Fur family transcriptional regulator [Chloroflexota bacterium]